jgi:hypothetical protein
MIAIVRDMPVRKTVGVPAAHRGVKSPALDEHAAQRSAHERCWTGRPRFRSVNEPLTGIPRFAIAIPPFGGRETTSRPSRTLG